MGCGMVLFQVMPLLPCHSICPVFTPNIVSLSATPSLSSLPDVLLPTFHRCLLWKGLGIHLPAPLLRQRRGRRRAT